MNKRYIIVEEYAEIIGAEVETAKEELKKDENRKYYAYINGQMVVDCEILGEIAFDDDIKIEIIKPTETEQQDNSFLLEEINSLKSTLQTKEKRIEELTDKIADFAERAQTIAERALNTTNQSQTLHAIDKGIISAEDDEKIEKKTEDTKRGFLARLFSKK